MYAEPRCVARLVAVPLLACALNSSAAAAVEFKPPVSYPTRGTSRSRGDFNGHGKPHFANIADGYGS